MEASLRFMSRGRVELWEEDSRTSSKADWTVIRRSNSGRPWGEEEGVPHMGRRLTNGMEQKGSVVRSLKKRKNGV
jgi:hypothetical protein